MDFLNQSLAQVSDLFKSMTVGARLTAGLLLLVIVVSLVYLVNHQTAAPDAELMGGEPLTLGELNAAQAAFNKAGLSNYEVQGSRIRVPRGQQAKYMGALADAGALPGEFGAYLAKAIASSSPLTDSKQREQINKVGMQAELNKVLRSMHGIENASVLYDVKKPTFGQESVATASVSVQPTGRQPLDDERVQTIRNTVATAIAGLKPENITVTDLSVPKAYPGGGSSGSLGSGAEDGYRRRKQMDEKNWEQKTRNALSYIPGVLVNVNVELDPETQHEETETVFDPKAVPFKTRAVTTNKNMKGPGSAGRPGLPAQNGVNQAATLTTTEGPENKEDNETTENTSAVSNKSRKVAQQGLIPKRVTVGVIIPSSYYEKVWEKENPTPSGQPPKTPDAAALKNIQDMTQITVEKAVAALLLVQKTSEDPYKPVTVTTFQDLPVAALPPPAIQDQALSWFSQYWSTLGMTGLALVSLLMLRSMVRSVPTGAPPPAAAATPTLSLVAEDGPEEEREQTVRNRLKRRGVTGPSLRDELTDMVREDPDAAVNILRNWIGNAS